jgi:hypothetical protein
VYRHEEEINPGKREREKGHISKENKLEEGSICAFSPINIDAM